MTGVVEDITNRCISLGTVIKKNGDNFTGGTVNTATVVATCRYSDFIVASCLNIYFTEICCYVVSNSYQLTRYISYSASGCQYRGMAR